MPSRTNRIRRRTLKPTRFVNACISSYLNIIRCYEDVDWKKAIEYTAFAVRASYHNILNASPGQLLFEQDMISRQLHAANWSYLSKRRFEAILTYDARENSTRLEHFLSLRCWSHASASTKFRAKRHAVANGPYSISNVDNNEMVKIDKGASTKQVSIRQFFLCYRFEPHGGSMTCQLDVFWNLFC